MVLMVMGRPFCGPPAVAARAASPLRARVSAGRGDTTPRSHHHDHTHFIGQTRVLLLRTIPGIGELLGLTIAAEIGDIARFGSPRKLIGYAGLAPRVNQSGDRSRTGALSKAGSRTLRWAAVEAAHQAWRPSNPWHELYTQLAARDGKNPAKSAVARKILIAAWHVLSRDEPFKPSRARRGAHPVSASSRCFLAA
jgi:transposase